MKMPFNIRLFVLAVSLSALTACGGGDSSEQQAPDSTSAGTNLERAGFGSVTVKGIESGTTISGGRLDESGSSR